MIVRLPSALVIDETVSSNSVQQVRSVATEIEAKVAPLISGRVLGHVLYPIDGGQRILVLPRPTDGMGQNELVLLGILDPSEEIQDLTDSVWFHHPALDRAAGDRRTEIQLVLESWDGAFQFVEEDPDRGILGLRRPQIGAIHAIHAHWAVSDAPATIVMPTGTGKSDTMVSILVSVRCPKLLVIVPTDALRTQIAAKFLTLGTIGQPNCHALRPTALYPVVCSLRHIPNSIAEVDTVFGNAQVVVTTSRIVSQCSQDAQKRIADHCPYLFIDEAHHVEAPTWRKFKDHFRKNRVVQFTATPFREDGKPMDGAIVFKYSLRLAQEHGYFTSIDFKPVSEFNRNRADEVIARVAVQQLREDLEKGHILMARVNNVARAEKVFELYAKYKEFNPVQLHVGVKSAQKRAAIRKRIVSLETRIVVCVDMLGEGFDLPELKIAAFHDIHKTLAVTLQLAGRFTRRRPDLGHATLVANTADPGVRDELRKLYSRDPDWNQLLPELSEKMVDEQVSLQEFLRDFTPFTDEIPLRTVRPATSAVVYRTRCKDWMPEKFREGIVGLANCEQVYETTNHREHTLIVVTARREPLPWTSVASLYGWVWELFVVIWFPQMKLLFINGSTNSGDYRQLARVIAGEDASLIKGSEVFKVFSGVNRLKLQNVGLTEQLGRNVRYTGRMGTDVESAMTEAQRGHGMKSVLAGSGYENARKTTVGASRKGRIWSHQRERVDQLVAWCRAVGGKILDPSIDAEQVLKGTLEPRQVGARPATMPICIDWPEEMYTETEAAWSVILADNEIGMHELSIELVEPSTNGPLKFAVVSEEARAEFELDLFASEGTVDYRFVALGQTRTLVRRGQAEPEETSDFFYSFPPTIWFSDGSSLEGDEYVELKHASAPYDATKIAVWDWKGVDIRRESQGNNREPDSIQARVIRELASRGYQIVIDDDGAGEVADVVAIRFENPKGGPSAVCVDLYHCKYSHETSPGHRISDLYEVCGQAQKCVLWMSSPERRIDIFTHLLRREAGRQEKGAPTRFEVGDETLLNEIRDASFSSDMRLNVFIVQPGLSRAEATRPQMELLAATENYLMETYQIRLGVIGSP